MVDSPCCAPMKIVKSEEYMIAIAMQKILVTMMALALTIAAQAQQYDGINTYTYNYGLSGRTTMLRATFKL